jgi:hypothetical protein
MQSTFPNLLELLKIIIQVQKETYLKWNGIPFLTPPVSLIQAPTTLFYQILIF